MSQPRVLHVNDVAYVGSTLVNYAFAMGHPWRLAALPVGGDGRPGRFVARRAAALPGFLAARARADVTHVHYAPNGYLGWGAKRFVLHCHGSDLRRDLHSRVLGPLARRSLRAADAVIVATPNLLPLAQAVRPDALWLPNPVAELFFVRLGAESVPGRVVCNMRWEENKGAAELLTGVRALCAAGVEVVGLDWGPAAPRAAAAGVRLVPKLLPAEFRELLASATVVLGQLGEPILTLSDLQALAQGKPVIGRDAYEGAPLRDPGGDLAATVQQVLAEEAAKGPAQQEADAAARRAWVRARHGEAVCLERLQELYHALGA
ncbi:glycosyltransferase [Buchananella hordeovulneris]|uniref:glycosyltransferase n=1 Tax=Buchananella hordeovulneris TaxID=52770 RepID=UPI0026DB55B8|nr:glycosyltransferase [Buchananella hordeovulneris]MDO5079969.1 hypothetical protein [Buchananella hordeovulneris]